MMFSLWCCTICQHRGKRITPLIGEERLIVGCRQPICSPIFVPALSHWHLKHTDVAPWVWPGAEGWQSLSLCWVAVCFLIYIPRTDAMLSWFPACHALAGWGPVKFCCTNGERFGCNWAKKIFQDPKLVVRDLKLSLGLTFVLSLDLATDFFQNLIIQFDPILVDYSSCMWAHSKSSLKQSSENSIELPTDWLIACNTRPSIWLLLQKVSSFILQAEKKWKLERLWSDPPPP